MHIKNFSRKTIAIAVAAGMSLGAVTVVAPTAGATSGYKGGEFVPDAETAYAENPGLADLQNEDEVIKILSKYPKSNKDAYPVWGYQGGYYTDVKVPEGTADGFAGRSPSGMVVPTVSNGFGSLQNVLSLKNNYQSIDRELSVDSKKVLYVAFSLVNDISKQNGLSPAAMSKLKAAGYTGDYGKQHIKTQLGENFDFYDNRPEESSLLYHSNGNYVVGNTPFIAGDSVAETAGWVAGAALGADTNGRDPNADAPATLDDIEKYFSGYVTGGAGISSLTGSADLGNAIINLARKVTTEDLAKADLKLRFVSGVPATGAMNYNAVYNPVFFDITNSKPAPVEDLNVSVDDLHVTDVKKDKNGNYVVTRNDGKTWTINLKDINDKVAALEAKDSPSREEFDNLKGELAKAKDGIDGLAGKDTEINKALDGLRNDLNKLEPRVDKLENRVDKLEKQVIKKVKDNGDGTYTLIRNDNSKVKGAIDIGDNVTKIVDNGDGSITVTHVDGSTDKINLAHTTITETNKGKPGHTITITSPDGKKVTLDVFDNYVKSIERQKNGDYLVKRNDGTEWIIKLSDIRKDIADLKGKDVKQDKRLNDLENRTNGADKSIADLGDRIAKNEGAIEDHRKSINDLNQEVGSINKELGDIKVELERLDGQDINSIRDNGDGTYTLIRNNGDEVIGVVDTSGDIKSITDNGDGTITLTHNDGSTEKVDLTHTKVETSGKPGDKSYMVTITTPDGNKVVFNGSNTYPSEVKDNGDGTYTIVLNDGSEVKGKIGDGQDIKELIPNDDGTMTVIHKDGTESKVDLKQVKITEQNKGTPNHTVTITSPNGDTVTFNVFDKYVTNVVKNENGDYDIYRSDVDGGKTVWKTLVLSDIRGKITTLEGDLDKLTKKQAADVKKIKSEIAGLEKEIEALQDVTADLDKRVSKLETNLAALTLRVTSLEGRVGDLENTDAAWAKCYAGIGTAGVPMLLALPVALMSDLNIPGLDQLNTEIQRTIGVYNPEAAKWMGENRGLFKAAAGALAAAGVLGMLIHTAKECQPYNETKGVKDNMTPIIEGSSKLAEKVESGSSKQEDGAENKSSSADAGSSSDKGNVEDK